MIVGLIFCHKLLLLVDFVRFRHYLLKYDYSLIIVCLLAQLPMLLVKVPIHKKPLSRAIIFVDKFFQQLFIVTIVAKRRVVRRPTHRNFLQVSDGVGHCLFKK